MSAVGRSATVGWRSQTDPLLAATLHDRSRSTSQFEMYQVGWVRCYVRCSKDFSWQVLLFCGPHILKGRAMKDFIKHFRRGRDGSWTCIADVEIRHTMGGIQVAEG